MSSWEPTDLGLLKADQLSGAVALELELHRHRLDQIAPAALLRLTRSELCRNPVEAMWWLLENPWMARALFGTGFVLEAIAFLLLPTGRLLS